jgi:lipopolysaccharide export LptBFGC system permease protein LptF
VAPKNTPSHIKVKILTNGIITNQPIYSSEAIITLILGFASIVLGIIALSLSLRKRDSNTDSLRRRLYFFGLGIAGLFLWAGWIIGPLLAFGAGLLPWKQKE